MMKRKRQMQRKNPQQNDEESETNDCVVMAQLAEDEANAIEDLEYLIDFDNRAKTRSMEIISESESD